MSEYQPPDDSVRIERNKRYAVRNYQEGKCISCGKDKGDSPYKRRCSDCVVKDRVRHQIKLKFKPWSGGRGRIPKTCIICHALRGKHRDTCTAKVMPFVPSEAGKDAVDRKLITDSKPVVDSQEE